MSVQEWMNEHQQKFGLRESRRKKKHSTVCWFCNADSGFFGFSKFVLTKRRCFFLACKGNDTGMELPLLSLKSQQSSINNFWKLIRMPLLFFDNKKWTNKQYRQKSVFLKVKWMFNGKKKVKWFVYSDWRKRCVVKKKFLS